MTAADGATARTIALQQEPDLILLDIRLPDIDGLTVLEKLRAGYCDAAVIVMTAYATSSNAIKATQNGAFDYITKPINDEHLTPAHPARSGIPDAGAGGQQSQDRCRHAPPFLQSSDTVRPCRKSTR